MLKLGVHKTFKGKKLYTEVWKDVVGYEGMYQVSNIGRVKGLSRIDGLGRETKSKILKGFISADGYAMVSLCKNGKKKHFQVHRLVAIAFIPNTENKPEIDHINTIPLDNRICNLRWVTRSENQNNPLTLKHKSEAVKGRPLPMEKIMKMRRETKDNKPVMCIETGVIYNSMREAERQTGINNASISSVCKGKCKKAGGYRWKLV